MMNIPSIQGILAGMRSPRAISEADFQLREHLEAAVGWIKQAHHAVDDGGISKGYDLLRNNWAPSYPETTGYTIPTLLNTATALNQPQLQEMALALADYLLQSATPEGGVAHWRIKQNPVIFDTGQVMFGWLAAHEESGKEHYLQAAARAGNWLASVQHSSGSWQKFQHLGVEKVIDTRVAWALLLLYLHTKEPRHKQAAVDNLEWAMQQQEEDGWFNRCAFTDTEDPFTHTLAYTAEGLFECGQILEEARYVAAAKRTADALMINQYPDGSLVSTYKSGWRETSRSSCLTGNCQMGRLWLRFYQTTGDRTYYTAAQKAITFVARTQNLHTSDANIRGAIAGSYPIYGRYERFKYPNWAAKFFIDALLTLDAAEQFKDFAPYPG